MTFSIIGGGIAGLTTAIALQRLGIQAHIFEAAPELRPLGAGIVLAANAMRAFQQLGIAEALIPAGKLLGPVSILDQEGHIISRADSRTVSRKYGIDSFTIHRGSLQQLLLEQLPPQSLTLGKRAIGFTRRDQQVEVQFADGSTHRTDYLLVADGVHSAIRQQLLPNSQPRYAGYTCWRAVVEGSDLNIERATESWGAGARFGIVPLQGGKIYWFACLNAPANDPRMRAARPKDLFQYFGAFHGPIPELLRRTAPEQLLWNDIIDLAPQPRYAFDDILLLGDAAHATTPNMGQGACQAIEDAAILGIELAKQADPVMAFRAFERRRLARTHYVVNTSWRLGKIAQLSNPWLARLRNAVLRLVPASINERQMDKLYGVEF